MHQTDTTIIEACKKDNELAQIQIYDRYCQGMFTVACRYLSNEEDAKDAMQEGFLKAFLNIKKFQPTATFGAWLKRIIINQCLDVLRQRSLKFSDDDPENLQIVDDENWDFDTTLTKADIKSAIAQLKEKHKIVVKLYLMEGYDHIEISEILDIPIKTSRTHLSRGKAQLREILKPKYNEARY
jgi:RNA polymerase sigma-70 factor (ECF subfamily)